MALLTMRFDLRIPAFAEGTHRQAYTAALEMAEWADRHGFTTVVLSEHHGVDDGYVPAPLPLAGAILGRTRNVAVTIAALLVPLYDPLRLAEDIAVLDLAGGGRLAIVAGLGYRDEEFEMFGVDRKRRGAITEETLRTLLQAWTGEPFEYDGRTVRVTPRPVTEPHPMVLVGGSTEIAAKRAARLGLPFMPAIGDEALGDTYRAECERLGVESGWVLMPEGPGFVHVARDPEKAWEVIGRHALYDASTYAGWQTPGQRSQVHVDAQS